MPEETYFGQTLPELVVNGFAWKHRQAVKKKKGREVANAVREGRDRLARGVAGWLPVTGDAMFVADMINNVKEGNLPVALALLASAALPGMAKKAIRLLARKTFSKNTAMRESLIDNLTEGNAGKYYLKPSNGSSTKDYFYTGNNAHIDRLKTGSYERLGLTEYPKQEIASLYKPYNVENPEDVKKLQKALGLTDDMLLRDLYMVFTPKFGNLDSRITTYRGSLINGQKHFNSSVAHEAHHGLMNLAKDKGVLPARETPPVDKKNYGAMSFIRGNDVNKRADIYNYLVNPSNDYDELAARGTQLLDYANIHDAKTPLTLEQFKQAYSDFVNDIGSDNNMTEFFDLFGKNPKPLLDWINKYSTSLLSGVVGTSAISKNKK